MNLRVSPWERRLGPLINKSLDDRHISPLASNLQTRQYTFFFLYRKIAVGRTKNPRVAETTLRPKSSTLASAKKRELVFCSKERAVSQ